MTLSMRNRFFKAGIVISALVFLAVVAVIVFIRPLFSGLSVEPSRRAPGILQGLAASFFPPSLNAPFAAIAAAVVFALVCLILIYRYFEKTSVPEILFAALFILSLAFEGLRCMIPLKMIYGLPGLYVMMGFRILIFARYAGLFSLFIASLCAAGLELQDHRYVFLIIAVSALVIALGIPVDSLAWDSSLGMISGYSTMFKLVETGIVLITVLSFLISAYTRGSKEYIRVCAGSFLALLGRNILLSADNWITPLPGLLLLALGVWFICTRLHRIYLWL
ncbi:hypothetical protein FACS1894147_11450 [Spirochaetia bacterium]|nr:hypothetical protein FACS1894147_11450 [Spirochaetia bacterium]